MNDAAPIFLNYKITLLAPAIFPRPSGDANTVETQAFIPGSAIRGALAGKLLSNGSDAESALFRALILSGSVRYLNAYPQINDERSHCISTAWKKQKNGDGAFDLACFSGIVTDDSDHLEEIWPEEQLSSFSDSFVAPSSAGGSWCSSTPVIDTRIHQQRDRIKGRPWRDNDDQEHGTIFAYESLEGDQTFRGCIIVMPESIDQIERIREQLDNQKLVIGRSRRAGYGGEAEIKILTASNQEYENAGRLIRKGLNAGDCFRVLLTSPYIGRNPVTGQIDPAAIEVELLGELDESATIERRYWSFELQGGFNRKWRIALPQMQSVAAGSTFVLKATKDISLEQLSKVQHAGIGLRRVDGFGRLLFQEHWEDSGTMAVVPRTERTVGEDKVQSKQSPLLKRMEARIVLTAAKQAIDRIAAIDMMRDRGAVPSSSLLSRLSNLFREVHDENSARAALVKLSTLCSENNKTALKETARVQLEKCSIKGKPLLRWLTELSKTGGDGSPSWERLVQGATNSSSLTGLATKHYLTSIDAAQAVLNNHSKLLLVYLIDAVLTALSRSRRSR
jgi:CRISPR-associated protein Csx10